MKKKLRFHCHVPKDDLAHLLRGHHRATVARNGTGLLSVRSTSAVKRGPEWIVSEPLSAITGAHLPESVTGTTGDLTMTGADSPTTIGDMTSAGTMIADAMRDAIHVMTAGRNL
jgi:hypothetical protein